MTEMNEEILDVLEENTIEKYVEKYYALEKKIENMLGKLKNCGVECDCDECYEFIINVENNERQKVCIDCGGYIEW